MPTPTRILIPFALVIGCAPLYRTEVVAQSSLSATTPTALQAELVIPAEEADAYLLSYELRLPRAMELAYEIRCPDGTHSGVLGETFEAYRTRRLAELEQERRRQAEMVGSLVGAVVPGVQARAAAQAPGASASAQATVRPGEVAEQAALQTMPAATLPPGDVGARTLRDTIEIGGSASGSCVFALTSNVPGQDISGATVDLVLARRIDVEAEQAEMAEAEAAAQVQAGLDLRTALALDLEARGATRRSPAERRQLAFDLRAGLAADLVAAGADPGLRARQRAEAEAARMREARLRAEAERREVEARLAVEAQERARREAERQERARLEAELLGIAWDARADIKASLIGLGADPDFRRRQIEIQARLDAEAAAREQQEREADRLRREQEQREAALRAQLELEASLGLRADLRADLVALGADPDLRRRQAEERARWEAAERERRDREAMLAEWTTEQQRLEAELRAGVEYQAALDVRADLRADLRAAGAVDRPPRPAPRYEERPAPPAEGAIWIPGEWVWDGFAWVWNAGRWEVRGAAVATGVGLGTLGLGVNGGVTVQSAPVTVQVEVRPR